MSEQLRHKMNDYAVAPPPAAWEAIAARLEDDVKYESLSAKMNSFEAPPPPPAWNNILDALNEKKENTVPVIGIRRIVYRVATAAAVIVFFIVGWMLINKHDTQQNDTVKKTVVAPVSIPVDKHNTADNHLPGKQPEPGLIMPARPGDQPTEKNTHTYLADAGKDHTQRYAKINNLAVQQLPAPKITAPPILDKNGEPIMDIDVLTVSSNYLLVKGPNGQLTRISSKFANVIRYLDANGTEEYLDKVIKESGLWKKRFQEWRSKISQSGYIPSSVNFLDIAELKELVQEK